MLARVPAEVLEGTLVGVEKLAQGLAEARLVKAPPGVAERQDEHMQRDWPTPQLDAGLAQSIWLCWPGAVSNRTVARSAACSAVRNGRTNRFTVS